MDAVKFLVPAAVVLGIAYAVGGSKAKTKPTEGRYEPIPGEESRPESDRMTFDDECSALIVRVRSADYDVRITTRYWQLRNQGIDDPEVIAADILAMDAPQCVWPPISDSPMKMKSVWEVVYPAVEFYWMKEMDGTLDAQLPIFGTAGVYIE